MNRVFPDGTMLMVSPLGYIRFVAKGTYIRHRRVGPALIYPEGYAVYIVDNKMHRTNGPAVIHVTGHKEYCVDGEYFTPEEFFLKYGVL